MLGYSGYQGIIRGIGFRAYVGSCTGNGKRKWTLLLTRYSGLSCCCVSSYCVAAEDFR